MANRKGLWSRLAVGGVVGLSAGCATDRVTLPPAHYPAVVGITDSQASTILNSTTGTRKAATPLPDGRPAPFNLPAAIPGSETPPVEVPQFGKDVSPADRDAAIRKLYPQVAPVSLTVTDTGSGAPPVSLGELHQIALANSPRIRKAQAEADVVYGQVIQAGLYPNPTVGYQVDQWQPNLRLSPGSTGSGVGQQGGYINLLIKTASKLTLAQQVAGYDYVNALVAVRKAQVDVTAQVRTAYFAAVVARRGVEVNRALADMADEVYRLQLKRVAAGVAATHEPFQFHAQAVQARNAVAQAEAAETAARKQLAAAVGQQDVPLGLLLGRSDGPAPALNAEILKCRLLDQHTDLLTARNQIAQAQTNLILQRRQPIPDLQTNTYHQYDNLAQTYQFGVQLGVQLPLSDRNQGNIRSARSRVVVGVENLRYTETDLLGRLAEAFGRYQANVKVAKSYREQVLPDLTQAYRGVVRQYQVEPEKVGFNEIVVAQQNLAQALEAYQSALDAQWKAVVDLAALGQLDDLFQDLPVEK